MAFATATARSGSPRDTASRLFSDSLVAFFRKNVLPQQMAAVGIFEYSCPGCQIHVEKGYTPWRQENSRPPGPVCSCASAMRAMVNRGGIFYAQYQPLIQGWCRRWHLQDADAEEAASMVWES